MFKLVLVLVAFLVVGEACKCKEQTMEESFCGAHWVSHLKVKTRVAKQGLPSDASRKGLNNLRYSVEHIKTLKTPANLTTLPDNIFTPSESPACGLKISAGREYLLAGRVEGASSLYTVLCGQIVPDSSTSPDFESLLEWKNVADDVQQKLTTIKC